MEDGLQNKLGAGSWDSVWALELGMLLHTCIYQDCGRLMQEDCHEFGANLGYSVRPCLYVLSPQKRVLGGLGP